VSLQSQPKFNPWLIGVVVAIAAFIEVLDTSIANVVDLELSLPIE